VAAGWHAAPATRVIALVAAGAPAMQRSLAAGQVVETEGVDTIADGLAVPCGGGYGHCQRPEARAVLELTPEREHSLTSMRAAI
jgi:hypothetical protein